MNYAFWQNYTQMQKSTQQKRTREGREYTAESREESRLGRAGGSAVTNRVRWQLRFGLAQGLEGR